MTFALLSFYVAALMLPQVPPVQSGPAEASVAGAVFDAESRNAIPGARVVLMPVRPMFPPGARGPQQTTTDANGQFLFDALTPGQYRIEVQKTGFAPFADLSNPRTLDVAPGRGIADLELVLKRGGAIAGRIVDAGGEAMADIMVTALVRIPGRAGQVMARTAQMTQTNDLGEFRLAGLPEGPYVVIASPGPRPHFERSSASAGSATLAPTYYPGTIDEKAAQIIDIASAQTVSGIEFAILSVAAYEVSGIVVDETGSPLAGAMVTFINGSRGGSPAMPGMGRTEQNGTFRMRGVVPGTYKVMAVIPAMWSARDGAGGIGEIGSFVTGGVFVGGAAAGGVAVDAASAGTWLTPSVLPASIEVTVDNADVTGLTIVLPRK